MTAGIICCSFLVKCPAKKRKNRSDRFSIRKPIAPPSRQIGKHKPEEKIHPTNRKGKHKREEELEN
jgi:hypothetical protein